MSASEPMVHLTGDSSTGASSSRSVGLVVCDVHRVARGFMSGTDANPFHRFVRCPLRKVTGCDFFHWVDDELTPYYLGSVQRLKQQKDALESQLQCKTLLNEVLNEKITLKDDELQRLRCQKASPPSAETYSITNPVVFSLAAAGVMFLVVLLWKLLSTASKYSA